MFGIDKAFDAVVDIAADIAPMVAGAAFGPAGAAVASVAVDAAEGIADGQSLDEIAKDAIRQGAGCFDCGTTLSAFAQYSSAGDDVARALSN